MRSIRRLALLAAAGAVAGAAAGGASAWAGDPGSGERLFRMQCGSCHATEAGRKSVGPTLLGVVGRPAGAVEGYKYSPANRRADIVWTPETLDAYLANPREVVPGTVMTYAGLRNATQRGNLISYLEGLR